MNEYSKSTKGKVKHSKLVAVMPERKRPGTGNNTCIVYDESISFIQYSES